MATALEDLYERDFYAWSKRQARGLRRLAAARPNEDIDWPRLIEEVDDLAKRERDAVRSQVRRILEHALKLEFSPAADPRAGWVDTIVDARDALRDKLSETLRRGARARLGRLYAEARGDAARRLRAYGEPEAAASLPEACPYTLDQVLDDGWYPESRHGLPDIP
jgi:hypothetical protein